MKFKKFLESAEIESAFWQDIAEDDDANSARLIYADWLEDNETSPNYHYVGILRESSSFNTVVVTFTHDEDEYGQEMVIDETSDSNPITWSQLVKVLQYPKEDEDFVYLTTNSRQFEYPEAKLGRMTSPTPNFFSLSSDHFVEGDMSYRRLLRVSIPPSDSMSSVPMWMWHCILRQAGWHVT